MEIKANKTTANYLIDKCYGNEGAIFDYWAARCAGEWRWNYHTDKMELTPEFGAKRCFSDSTNAVVFCLSELLDLGGGGYLTGLYYNVDSERIEMEDDIYTDFCGMQADDPEGYCMSDFAHYMEDCTSKNGSLRKIW